MKLIVISGLTGSGKTSIALRLARDMRVPLIIRDDIKEQLFEVLGTGDRAGSRILGKASYRVMFAVLQRLMMSRKPFMVESNFTRQATKPLTATIAASGYDALHIIIRADDRVRLRRIHERARRGERHPGHPDARRSPNIRDIKTKVLPLELPGKAFIVNTSNSFDYAGLRWKVKQWLSSRSG